MRGCYVMGIWDLTDMLYVDGDHDETEKGRKSPSRRLNGGEAGEQATVRRGDAIRVLSCGSWSCSIASMEPQGYPPAAEVIQWLQPWRSTQGQAPLTVHSCKSCSALLCGSVDEWSRAREGSAHSGTSLHRWQQGLGPLRMSCECMGMLQKAKWLLLIIFYLMIGLCHVSTSAEKGCGVFQRR